MNNLNLLISTVYNKKVINRTVLVGSRVYIEKMIVNLSKLILYNNRTVYENIEKLTK